MNKIKKKVDSLKRCQIKNVRKIFFCLVDLNPHLSGNKCKKEKFTRASSSMINVKDKEQLFGQTERNILEHG